MKLENCLALRDEILDFSTPLASAAAATMSFKPMAKKKDFVKKILENVAIGVTVAKKNQYKLAVFCQRRGPQVDAVVEQIAKKAKQEIESRYIGRISAIGSTPAFFQKRHRPLIIGCQISEGPSSSFMMGSLGCFVQGPTGKKFILSNNHVMAGVNQTPLKTPIYQNVPGTSNVVAKLSGFVKLISTGNLMDAAIAELESSVTIDTRTVGDLGQLQGVVPPGAIAKGTKVHKCGRTTGQTNGKLEAFSINNVTVAYPDGNRKFDQQMVITSATRFAKQGDSGSVIVTAGLDLAGLLFSCSDDGLTTFANPINTVFDKFKISLL